MVVKVGYVFVEKVKLASCGSHFLAVIVRGCVQL